MNEQPNKLIDEARQAFISGARELMADAAFRRACFDLHQQWVGEFIETDEMDKIITLHSHLKALARVQKIVASMMLDNKVQRR